MHSDGRLENERSGLTPIDYAEKALDEPGFNRWEIDWAFRFAETIRLLEERLKEEDEMSQHFTEIIDVTSLSNEDESNEDVADKK